MSMLCAGGQCRKWSQTDEDAVYGGGVERHRRVCLCRSVLSAAGHVIIAYTVSYICTPLFCDITCPTTSDVQSNSDSSTAAWQLGCPVLPVSCDDRWRHG